MTDGKTTLRITGGEHRSRKIRAPQDKTIRPTADKVRQALFNILESHDLVDNATVLDAFCGTGALGLDALSRGATHAVFLDYSPTAIRLCRDNIATLRLENRATLLQTDSSNPGLKPERISPATLVFLDPPYHKGLIEKAIIALRNGKWLAPEVVLILEFATDEASTIPPPFTGDKNEDMELLTEKRYGETGIRILRYSSNDF